MPADGKRRCFPAATLGARHEPDYPRSFPRSAGQNHGRYHCASHVAFGERRDAQPTKGGASDEVRVAANFVRNPPTLIRSLFMKTLTLASGAVLLALLAASPAAAGPLRPYIIEQVEVRHGDLDLSTAAGAGAMLERLSAAASEACGRKPRPGFSDPLGPRKQRAWRLCTVAAIESATLELDAELVRAAWLGRDDAIRYGAEARRTSAGLYRLAGVEAPAAPARGG